VGWIPRHADEAEETVAALQRMGFTRVGRTRDDDLTLAQRALTLEDIVRPER
jgi:hypothetical protein